MPADLTTILAEHGVRIVPTHMRRGPGETHAERTLAKLLERHGPDHLRDVLTCLMESENNRMALVAPVLVAVSGLLVAHAAWWERDAGRWLEVLDRLDLAALHERVKANREAAKPAHAIATVLYAELSREFGVPRTPSLFDRMMETCP